MKDINQILKHMRRKMNKALKYSLYTAIGLATAGISYGVASFISPTEKEKTPTNIFYTEIDGITAQKENEDLFIGYDDKTLEAWVRNDKGALVPFSSTQSSELSKLESEKSKELSKAQSEYQNNIKNLKENFEGLRKKLEE